MIITTKSGVKFAVGERPPIWRILKYLYGYDPEGTVLVAFGDRVYASRFDPMITINHFDDHEWIHLVMQNHSRRYAWYWWTKYILPKKFRLQQEVQAYQFQLKRSRSGIYSQALERTREKELGKLVP